MIKVMFLHALCHDLDDIPQVILHRILFCDIEM